MRVLPPPLKEPKKIDTGRKLIRSFDGGASILVSSMRFDGVSDQSAILIVTGDGSGTNVTWTATPRTAGNTWNDVTPNAYTTTSVARQLTPGTTYDVTAVTGSGTANGTFTTKALPVEVPTGKQTLRRLSY